MTESPRCPKCGTQLPADAPAGLCPKCLVQAGFESQPAVDSAEPGPTKLTPPASGFVPPTVEELAPLFPQLEILDLLGKGGMGAVYKARQPGLDRLVAVKILPPEISHDPTFAERFQREARALARLSHPHIVAVYDFGVARPESSKGVGQIADSQATPFDDSGRATHGSLCYIVMEFVDGANLRQAIQTKTLTSAEALAIVPQICEALQFAHDEGIVHRDIKPENILIDKRGRVKIADFGLAKLLGTDASDHSLTATNQVMGTLRYMAPEQMQGSREVDHRADIYSLGVVFYELLTGELPMGRFAPPSKKVQVDVRLDEVVLRALEQDPEQRYQHASDVKDDLEEVARTEFSPTSFAARAAMPDLRSVVNALTSHAPAETPRPMQQFAGGPRFSRFAIAGAVWAFFGLLAIIPTLYFIGLNRVWNGTALPTDVIHSEPPVVFTIFMGALLVIGSGAPIGTTIYGAVAIGRIKRSGGTIVGLPLAVVDVLFFPLLVLFAGIAVPVSLALHSFLPLQMIAVAVPSAMFALVVCLTIGFAVWRKVIPDSALTISLREQLRFAGIALLIAGIMDALSGLVWIGHNVSVLVELLKQGTPIGWQVASVCLSLCSLWIVYYVVGVALHLMTLEDDGNFTFCLLTAAIVPPGCLIGLPAAIYAMVQLSKPEVKALIPKKSSEPQASTSTSEITPGVEIGASEPRLSRLALWGAIWGGLGLLGLIVAVFLTTLSGRAPSGQSSAPPESLRILALVIVSVAVALGATSIFGTTICGAVAIGHIKHSAGKLYGLWLAAADALLFPMLVLGGLIAALVARVGYSMAPHPNAAAVASAGAIGVLVALIVCFFVARAVWRAIARPDNPIDQPPPTSPKSMSRRRKLLIATATLLAIGIPVAVWLESLAWTHKGATSFQLGKSQAYVHQFGDHVGLAVWIEEGEREGAGFSEHLPGYDGAFRLSGNRRFSYRSVTNDGQHGTVSFDLNGDGSLSETFQLVAGRLFLVSTQREKLTIRQLNPDLSGISPKKDGLAEGAAKVKALAESDNAVRRFLAGDIGNVE